MSPETEIWGEFRNNKVYMLAYKSYWSDSYRSSGNFRKIEEWEIIKFKLLGIFEYITFGQLFTDLRNKK